MKRGGSHLSTSTRVMKVWDLIATKKKQQQQQQQQQQLWSGGRRVTKKNNKTFDRQGPVLSERVDNKAFLLDESNKHSTNNYSMQIIFISKTTKTWFKIVHVQRWKSHVQSVFSLLTLLSGQGIGHSRWWSRGALWTLTQKTHFPKEFFY